MSIVSVPAVTVVGARSRDLETFLAATGVRVTSVAGSELAALAHTTSRPSQVVILDLREAGTLPGSVATLRRNHPDTAVVLVVSSLDPHVLLEAMRAGVTEIVPEPISQAALEAAIGRVWQAAEPESTGKVFAVVGAKGGVGATTIAANIATVLAREASGEALLIDLHLAQGDAALLLGVAPRHSVVDALENTHRLDEAYLRGLVVQTQRGANLLASSERHVIGAPGADRVRTLVEFASRFYQYVVLDVPRADLTVLDGLDSAQRIVVVVNQELSAIRNATRLVEALAQRYGKQLLTLALSRFDKGADIVPEDIEKVVGLPVSFVIPNDYRAAIHAVNHGQPLALADGHKISSAIKDMTRELAGLRPASPQAPARGGLLGRLALRRTTAL
jgi:pilus assembly protein CpaE